MDRAQKSELVASLNGVFNSTGVVIVAHYKGLTVAEMSQYRAQMREAGAAVKVAKNRLVKIALQGTAQESISDLFIGPTVLAYSDDPVAAPKVATEFAKKNQKLVILGGALGSQALDPDGVKALADLPSLDELRGKILGMLATPATRIAQVVNAPAGQLARVLSAYSEKDNAA